MAHLSLSRIAVAVVIALRVAGAAVAAPATQPAPAWHAAAASRKPMTPDETRAFMKRLATYVAQNIPTGLDAGTQWDGLSDTGGHAHLLKAAAMYLLRLDGKNDWQVHHVPTAR